MRILGWWLLIFFRQLPQGSKYLIIIYSPNPNLHNYCPKTEYLTIGFFGPLGLLYP